MRWLVEVSAIGKGDPQSFCVTADSWQRALQIVRAHRGETSAMSGFSIELLEEGYRAVDPVARLRFVVKRAGENTPLSPIDMTAGVGGSKPPGKPDAPKPGASTAPPAVTPSQAERPKPDVKPEPPKAEAPKAAVPPAAESKPKAGPPRPGAGAPAKTNGKSVPPKAIEPTPAPPKAMAVAPSTTLDGPTTVAVPVQIPPQAVPSQPLTEPAPTVVAPQPVGAPLPGLPSFTVLSKREEHPSPSAPLSYREYVFIVPKGTAEGVAVSVLLGQLDLVQAALAGSRSGKLVQLAIFDETYTGKPPRPPIATLVWKDWRGEPVVSFPRRASVAPPPGSVGTPSSSVPALKPASIPPKATLVEPKTTLEDTRALKPDLPPPDTEVTRTDVDINLAKTTETPMFVPPPEASPNKVTMVGIATQAFGSPDSPAKAKSVPPPAPVVSVSASVSVSAPEAVAPAAPVAPAAVVTKSVPPPAALPAAAPVVPATNVAPAAPVVKSVPPPAPVAAAPAKSVPPPAPVPAFDGSATMPMAPTQAIPPPAVLGVEKAPDFTPPPAPARMQSSSRIPIPKVGSRTSGDEVIALLFEAMHDLHFLHDAIEGADFCLQLAQEVIPSRAGFAHFFDVEKREFCLVRAKGESTGELIGKRHLEGEPILSAVVKAKRAVVRGSDDTMTNRYIAVGGAKSLVLAPVLVAGRTLAIFEMVNPNDGAPFTQDEANAMNYIAEQFGEFLSSRGLVFDHGRSR